MSVTASASTNNENRNRLKVMALSVAVSTLLMASKFYAFWLTGSSAVLSDALESIINVVASSFALGSVVLAAKPPDPSHPYGHGKAEFFSAGFEGALIILAAGWIVWESAPRILQPSSLPHLDAGLLVLLATGIANFGLGLVLVRTGRRTRSAAIAADGKHILTDVYTSAGVLIGLVLVRQTGWYWLDGAIACLVAVNIIFIGVRLVRESFSNLMDASDPNLLDEITGVITRHRRESWIDIHHLRAWRSGERIHVDFHIILPRDLSLEQAHREVMEIESLLKSHVPGLADALIHAEPCLTPECPICGYDVCAIRGEPAQQQNIWVRETVTPPAPANKRVQRSWGRKDARNDRKSLPGQ